MAIPNLLLRSGVDAAVTGTIASLALDATADVIFDLDPDRRRGYDVDAAFEIAECHCRESGAVVNQVVCHMRETGPVVEGYYLNDLVLVDFNFRQSELPMVIFTVRATYLIGD